MNALQRLHHRWLMWQRLPESLNRRAAVEAELFDMAAGKRPLPDQQKCREMALKLGVPELKK